MAAARACPGCVALSKACEIANDTNASLVQTQRSQSATIDDAHRQIANLQTELHALNAKLREALSTTVTIAQYQDMREDMRQARADRARHWQGAIGALKEGLPNLLLSAAPNGAPPGDAPAKEEPTATAWTSAAAAEGDALAFLAAQLVRRLTPNTLQRVIAEAGPGLVEALLSALNGRTSTKDG